MPAPALSLLPHSATWSGAMFSSKDSCPSLLGGLHAFLPNQPSQLGFHPFPRPGGPHRRQPTQTAMQELQPAGAAPRGPFHCPPHWMLRIPKTGIKSFKKRTVHFENFSVFPFSTVFMGRRAKDDNVFIQVLEHRSECPTLSPACGHRTTIPATSVLSR